MARQSRLDRTVVSLLDNGSKLQSPAVDKYVERLRRAHPDESPAQIIERIEHLFLNSVTGSGAAVGATAAVPAIGTVATLAAAGAETVFFLEASALMTLAVASVHGIHPADHEQRRALVLAVALGDSGAAIMARTLGKTNKTWVNAIGGKIPGIKSVNETLLRKFVTQYAAKRSALLLGKIVPAGIGAVIGSVGNRAIGKKTIEHARSTFGPAPTTWPNRPPGNVVNLRPAIEA
ncbi:hypothetical protein [Aldersonia kunmingensis]|uniref:hypothetical protein n=1 Tax=Aldersonia kunmingensis TaxID=408066 RepID=UPI000837437C|nr:hypothetical protein [Aldersonia kunmingensis]